MNLLNLLKFLTYYDKSSIADKFKFYFKLYYLPIVFILIIIANLFLYYIENENLILISWVIGVSSLFFVILYVVTIKLISNLIKNIILNKLELISKDLENIKKEKKFKKISIVGTDELDSIIYDLNLIFDDFNLKLLAEKECSLIDPLTNIFNRRALESNFNILFEKSKRDKSNICLLLIDIDNFKQINDTYGHNIGDEVLINLTKVIKENLRKYDSIYRIGGEEFVIILPNLKKDKKKDILTRIKKQITLQLALSIPKIQKPITISGGCVSSEKYMEKNNLMESSKFLSLMIRNADSNLYKAKKSGKNKIIVS